LSGDATYDGECRCGQVRFRLTGGPLITMACHCKGCQRMTSGAYSLSAFYPAARFELISGEPVPGAMHGPSRHMYCAYCMSWVFTRTEGTDDFVNVRSPMIDGDVFGKRFLETGIDEAFPWARLDAPYAFDGFPPRDKFPALIAAYLARSADQV
jgi:hypothetical protein